MKESKVVVKTEHHPRRRYMGDSDTISYCNQIEVSRPKDWPDLDMSIIEAEVGEIDSYEYKLIQNQCKTEQLAIRAIRNKRQSDEDYYDIMDQAAHDRKRDHYFRKKMNDLEEDKEEHVYAGVLPIHLKK